MCNKWNVLSRIKRDKNESVMVASFHFSIASPHTSLLLWCCHPLTTDIPHYPAQTRSHPAPAPVSRPGPDSGSCPLTVIGGALPLRVHVNTTTVLVNCYGAIGQGVWTKTEQIYFSERNISIYLLWSMIMWKVILKDLWACVLLFIVKLILFC